MEFILKYIWIVLPKLKWYYWLGFTIV
jgi:hypothetical protein